VVTEKLFVAVVLPTEELCVVVAVTNDGLAWQYIRQRSPWRLACRTPH
jgi:hypothetical protein